MANFRRKNLDPNGIYNLVVKVAPNELGQPEIKEKVVITGRELFSTDSKKLIETLRNDPEIEEYEPETTIEPNSQE